MIEFETVSSSIFQVDMSLKQFQYARNAISNCRRVGGGTDNWNVQVNHIIAYRETYTVDVQPWNRDG